MSRLIVYLKKTAKDDSAASAGVILMLFMILVTVSIISMIIFACGDPGKPLPNLVLAKAMDA